MFIFRGRGGSARIKEAGKKCYTTSNNGGCKSIRPAHNRNRPILYGCDSHPPPPQSGALPSPDQWHIVRAAVDVPAEPDVPTESKDRGALGASSVPCTSSFTLYNHILNYIKRV